MRQKNEELKISSKLLALVNIPSCYDERMTIHKMYKDIEEYHYKLADAGRQICEMLYEIISESSPQAESKVWHAHPVWFLENNPIVGYHKLKNDVRLMFWSGQSFDEQVLIPTGSFRAAEIRHTDASQINREELMRCLAKSTLIQWDYKNIIKNRGLLALK